MKKILLTILCLISIKLMAQDAYPYQLPEYTAVVDDSTDVLYIDDSGTDKHIEIPTIIKLVSDSTNKLRGEVDTAKVNLRAEIAAGGVGWSLSGDIIDLVSDDDSVGIGTDAPVEKLEIDGNAKADTIVADVVQVGSYAYGYESGDDYMFKDANNPSGVSLSSLVSGGSLFSLVGTTYYPITTTNNWHFGGNSETSYKHKVTGDQYTTGTVYGISGLRGPNLYFTPNNTGILGGSNTVTIRAYTGAANYDYTFNSSGNIIRTVTDTFATRAYARSEGGLSAAQIAAQITDTMQNSGYMAAKLNLTDTIQVDGTSITQTGHTISVAIDSTWNEVTINDSLLIGESGKITAPSSSQLRIYGTGTKYMYLINGSYFGARENGFHIGNIEGISNLTNLVFSGTSSYEQKGFTNDTTRNNADTAWAWSADAVRNYVSENGGGWGSGTENLIAFGDSDGSLTSNSNLLYKADSNFKMQLTKSSDCVQIITDMQDNGATNYLQIKSLDATNAKYSAISVQSRDAYGDITMETNYLNVDADSADFSTDVHIGGDLTVDGSYPSDYAITDEQPSLKDYWNKTLELNKLPAMEDIDRRNVMLYIGKLEETNERLLRYIVEMEKRITELENQLK